MLRELTYRKDTCCQALSRRQRRAKAAAASLLRNRVENHVKKEFRLTEYAQELRVLEREMRAAYVRLRDQLQAGVALTDVDMAVFSVPLQPPPDVLMILAEAEPAEE